MLQRPLPAVGEAALNAHTQVRMCWGRALCMQTKRMARRTCDRCQGPWTTIGAQCSARRSLHAEQSTWPATTSLV
jgi:hypothetical protein